MEEFKKYFRNIKHNKKARIGVGALFVTTFLVLIPIELQDDNTSKNKNIISNSNYETSSMSPGNIETITIESNTSTSQNENKIESSTLSQNENKIESNTLSQNENKIESNTLSQNEVENNIPKIKENDTNSNNIKENNVEDKNTISDKSNSNNDTINNKEEVVGIDDKITSILYNYICESTSTYNGVKSSELKALTRKVALGEISESNAKNTIESMKWKENANSIDINYPNEVKDISTYEVNCTRTIVPGNLTGEQIAQNYNFNLGQFSDIIAFRNSDNSITVTSVSCSLLISSVNVE